MQEREFFGLRDFYRLGYYILVYVSDFKTFVSLIKMLYYMCEKTDLPPTWPQLEHAIKRNFGGLESDKWNPYNEFTKHIQMSHNPPDLKNIAPEV